MHGCSPVNLLHIFSTPFSKNTSGRLLLFHDVYLGLCLVGWFTSLRDFFIRENVYVMNIVTITRAALFSKEEVLRR